ncbi:MAG TPA: LLM class F420-dependent oxidoreductase [Streptosporangiaceae bacterium]|jgi:probable F420-dependent oxidoreductase
MTAELRDRLGRFGVWRRGDVAPELAAAIERLGFGALWIGGSPDGDLAVVERLLDATDTLMLGTSIVNIWKDDAQTVARSYTRLDGRHPGRFVLGVGAGHREATQQYEKPYEALAQYVETLRTEGVPQASIVLAALGPKVLRLAGDRTAGAIPYLVPPEHTRQARAILGPRPLLAPEHKVVLDPDPVRAREIGRPRVRTPYLGLVNYTSNLRRLGWTDEDLAGGGSDALIDALVAHGTADQVAARLHAHLDAGADHVVIQLLTESDADLVPGYQELASSLSR